jgi:hypothetical protein
MLCLTRKGWVLWWPGATTIAGLHVCARSLLLQGRYWGAGQHDACVYS